MAPDDVLEDLADVLRLVERGQDGVDGARADLVAALDQFGQLVDDGARLGDARVVAFDREPVPAQEQRDPEPLAQRVEDAVADGRELGGDVVRNRENLLHPALSVGAAAAGTAARERHVFGTDSAQTRALFADTLTAGGGWT